MVKVIVTDEFQKKFSNLPNSIQKKDIRKINVFALNPFHRSLRVEKINPSELNIWSFRIDISYRILFRFLDSNNTIFLLIDHHENIYRYHELK